MIKTHLTAIYRSLGARCAVVRATTSDPQHGERAIYRGLRWGVAALRVRRSACPMPRDSMGHRAAQRSYPEGGYAP